MTQPKSHTSPRSSGTMLDVVKRASDFVLYAGNQPMKTPEGDEITHHNPRTLQHIIREIITNDTHALLPSAQLLYRTVRLLQQHEQDPLLLQWNTAVAQDPLIDKKAFESEIGITHDPAFMLELLDQQQDMSFFFNGLTGAVKCFNEFLIDYSEGHFDFSNRSIEQICDISKHVYDEMTSEENASVQLLCAVHCCGVLLPLLLVTGHITISEYINALFSLHTPHPDNIVPGTCAQSSFLSVPPETPMVLPNWQNAHKGFSEMCPGVYSILEYLKTTVTATETTSNVEEIIRKGECFSTEFKSTLRWNLRSEKKDSAIEHAALKTINAFLNSSGGCLLIGVSDDGTALGLDDDRFANEDKFSLHFWNMVKASMGQDVSPLIRTTFETYQDRTIFLARCSRSPQPVFLHQKGFEEEFYIRVGPSSANLSVREALKYIAGRFEEPISA